MVEYFVTKGNLVVRNKATKETREYIFTESLKLPYDIEKYL